MFFINLLSITENIGVMFDLVIVKVISRVLSSMVFSLDSLVIYGLTENALPNEYCVSHLLVTSG